MQNIHRIQKAHPMKRPDPEIIRIHTGPILSLSTSHAAGVFEVLSLVLPGQAQVHDDLGDDDDCDIDCDMRMMRITCVVPL